MKNSTKILIGVVVVALVGAGVYFGNTKLQTGSLKLLPAYNASKPIVSTLATGSTKLNNGPNNIGAVQIKAPADKPIALKQITFNVDSKEVTISNWELYRKIGSGVESNITNGVEMITSSPSPYSNNPSNPAISYSIYITWKDQEFINKGISNTYILRSTVSDAQSGDFVQTYLLNDGSLLKNKTADNLLKWGSKFIWSDLSARGHSTETKDWFDGSLQHVLGLPTESLKLTF